MGDDLYLIQRGAWFDSGCMYMRRSSYVKMDSERRLWTSSPRAPCHRQLLLSVCFARGVQDFLIIWEVTSAHFPSSVQMLCSTMDTMFFYWEMTSGKMSSYSALCLVPARVSLLSSLLNSRIFHLKAHLGFGCAVRTGKCGLCNNVPLVSGSSLSVYWSPSEHMNIGLFWR